MHLSALASFADNRKTSTYETVTDAEPLHNPVLTLNIGWTIPERTEGIAIHSISEESHDHNSPSTSCSSWIQAFSESLWERRFGHPIARKMRCSKFPSMDNPLGLLVGASGRKLLREPAFSAGIFFDCFFTLVWQAWKTLAEAWTEYQRFCPPRGC
jgi:hypothetical protein